MGVHNGELTVAIGFRIVLPLLFLGLAILSKPTYTIAAHAQTIQVGPTNIPSQTIMSVLVKTALIALNQANQTGNYSVLLELASPKFRAANSSADISAAFAKLRLRSLDLSPIVVYKPSLTKKPVIDARGYLRLVGFIPTKPLRVNFDMSFAKSDKLWRLSALSVGTSHAAEMASAKPAKKAAAKKIIEKPRQTQAVHSAHEKKRIIARTLSHNTKANAARLGSEVPARPRVPHTVSRESRATVAQKDAESPVLPRTAPLRFSTVPATRSSETSTVAARIYKLPAFPRLVPREAPETADRQQENVPAVTRPEPLAPTSTAVQFDEAPDLVRTVSRETPPIAVPLSSPPPSVALVAVPLPVRRPASSTPTRFKPRVPGSQKSITEERDAKPATITPAQEKNTSANPWKSVSAERDPIPPTAPTALNDQTEAQDKTKKPRYFKKLFGNFRTERAEPSANESN